MAHINNSANRRLIKRELKRRLDAGLITQVEYNEKVNTLLTHGDGDIAIIRQMLKEIKGANVSKSKPKETKKVDSDKKEKAVVNPDVWRTRISKLQKRMERKEKLLKIFEERVLRADRMKEKAIKERDLFSDRLQKDKDRLQVYNEKLESFGAEPKAVKPIETVEQS